MDQSMSRYTRLIREEPGEAGPVDSFAACELLLWGSQKLHIPEDE